MIICVTPLFHLTYIKNGTDRDVIGAHLPDRGAIAFIHTHNRPNVQHNLINQMVWMANKDTFFVFSRFFFGCRFFFFHNETINGSSMRE